jgi:hypothetical protein
MTASRAREGDQGRSAPAGGDGGLDERPPERRQAVAGACRTGQEGARPGPGRGAPIRCRGAPNRVTLEPEASRTPVRLFAITWEAPEQVGWQFGYTADTSASPSEILDRFCMAADIAAEEGTGDPMTGGHMRRHGRVIDLGTAAAPPDGFPGTNLDQR